MATINDTITILRAAQVGLAAMVAELENFAEPVDLFGNPATVKPKKGLPMHAFTSREECITVLRTIDPEYNTDGVPLDALRRRVTEVLANETSATLEATGPVYPDAFRPPGIDPDPEKIELANGLSSWWNEVMETREPFVRQFQAVRDCDLRCRRPGGACPMVAECHAALATEGEDQ